MDYLRLRLLLLCIGMGALLSCSRMSPSGSDETLARVGNEYLTVQEAKEKIPEYVFEQDSINALTRYRDEWIQSQVLLQEADRLGLSQQAEIQRKLRKARDEVLKQALKDYVTSSNQDNITITDEEARTYYQANKEQFVLNEEFVQFRHVRTKTHEQARQAREDLRRGIPWPQVAREYAIDPEQAIHKSNQYWPISMALNEIEIMNRYLNVIGQNERSPIQRVNGVYHFVQLIDRRSEGEHPDLDWLIEQIKEWMVLNRQRRSFSSYVKNLYLKAKSNNEVETYNVLPTNSNQKTNIADSLESFSTDE
jgi:hypothetical protein